MFSEDIKWKHWPKIGWNAISSTSWLYYVKTSSCLSNGSYQHTVPLQKCRNISYTWFVRLFRCWVLLRYIHAPNTKFWPIPSNHITKKCYITEPLTIFVKSSILDVRLGSKCASDVSQKIINKILRKLMTTEKDLYFCKLLLPDWLLQ